jgi:hypothetical protein
MGDVPKPPFRDFRAVAAQIEALAKAERAQAKAAKLAKVA